MMLPILFRKHRRYNAYNRGSRRGGYSRRSRRTSGAAMVLGSVVTLVVLFLLWYFVPLTTDETPRSDATIVAESRYVLMDDTTALLSFSNIREDGVFENVSADSHRRSIVTDTLPAQWVRPYEYLPYNGSHLIALPTDTLSACTMPHGSLLELLRKEHTKVQAYRKHLDEQKADVEYYLGTHTVLDNGFDIVARYSNRLKAEMAYTDSIIALTAKALNAKKLKVKLQRDYFVVSDSLNHLLPCNVKEANETVVKLSASSTCPNTPAFFHRLRRNADALALLEEKAKAVKPKAKSFVDSLGYYTGRRDSLARPHGYGSLKTWDGAYYEGEWQHGKRSGVGFMVEPGKKLQLGEWKDDAYLGERITYTPQRIYGIDISRHQHEKGRKRYSIDWRDLRITSLGRMSKKVIHGEVNYPVRFVFIKATEGVTIRNKYFMSDYAAARRHGYRAGAYHFFSVRTTGAKQAQNFLRNSRYQKGDLPPALDLEPTDAQIRQAGGLNALFKNVRQWLNAVEKKYGVRPILYVSQRFVNKYLPQAPDLYNGYEVWIARYGEYKPTVKLRYWQLSPDGRVKGIHGDVDINVLNEL